MRARLLRAMVVVAIVAVVTLGVPLGFVAARVARNDAVRTLDREADNIGFAVDDEVAGGRPPDRETIARHTRAERHAVVVDGRGNRIAVGQVPPGRTIHATVVTAHGARITIVAPARDADRRARRAWLLVGGLAAGAVLTAVALARLETPRLARPLDDLAAASARLGAGDFSGRAPRSGLAEVDAVADALDASAARIAELVRAEREFAANASHQLRTPLTALRIRVEEALAADDRDDARAEAEAALREADRLEQTITALLAVARGREAGLATPLDVTTFVERWAAPWRAVLARHGRDLAVVAPVAPTATASEAVVAQVLDVLADNALRHGAGTVTVEIRQAGTHAAIRLWDEGDGVLPGLERAIFERRVSSAGSTGVGLALARELAASTGGRLELVSARPAAFELYLAA